MNAGPICLQGPDGLRAHMGPGPIWAQGHMGPMGPRPIYRPWVCISGWPKEYHRKQSKNPSFHMPALVCGAIQAITRAWPALQLCPTKDDARRTT